MRTKTRSTLKSVLISLRAQVYVRFKSRGTEKKKLTYPQKKVGTIAKDNSSGPFADEWKSAFGDISKDVEEFDISNALSSAALAVKDENELVGSGFPTS